MANVGLIILLSVAHLITDVNQGALPAILPFFIKEYGLSYTAAAAIVFATNGASAVIQPIFGHFADRFSKPWLMPLALLMAGLGIAMSGLVPFYFLIILFTVFSGIGIAAFHPQAARLINFAAGDRKGTAMSFFGLGGTLGFAIGPIIATFSLINLGLKGTLVLIFPVTITAVILGSKIPLLKQLEAKGLYKLKNGGKPTGKDHWAGFSILSIMVMARSVIFFGLITFVPLYWTGHLHQSIVMGGIALTTLTVSGVIGNFTGGWVSDRIGRKKTTIIGFLVLAIVLPIFVSIENPLLAFMLLIPIGFSHSSTYSPSIVMGQEYLPNHVGFSSGVTLGIAVAFGGIAAPFIGRLADNQGIWWALALVSVIPLLTLLLSSLLPTISKE